MRALWGRLFILGAMFWAGWTTHGWYVAHREQEKSQAAESTRQAVAELSRQSGEALEKKLAELRANETHTERVIHTETIKPVFSNICATDDYVRLLNESIDKASGTLSGKSAGAVPGEPAQTGGGNRR